MADDVLINKAATIERCVARAREEYAANPESFATDYTRQDAAILNIQRACEAALDMGQHLIRREKLGIPQSTRDVFSLLAHGGWINIELADSLKRMVGFRNIAVHDYIALQLPITVRIIENHLDEFLQYSQTLLLHDAALGGNQRG
ncbi:type VII toxin-antitoxin system HepT family RNase toxin [Nitrosomonas europaea]|uniref:type VII toxin-antitoxin system HepT family RNase toxin n=1 Tax=Nitrosomonas europaea TaxID=915 RepID=UPI003BB5B65F